MNGSDYSEIYWPKIDGGKTPYFDICVMIMGILKKESQKERYSNNKSVICMTISSLELRERLEANEINISPLKLSKIVRTFFHEKNISFVPKPGPSVKYGQITYTHDKLKELNEWALGVGMRRLFYS